MATEIPRRLGENAFRLSIHHWLTGDVAGGGFATATAMAGELGAGASQLFSEGLAYAGAALVRQLLECTYLVRLMAEDRSEAESWMASSHDEVVAKFMPSRIRKRSDRPFRRSEYTSHCDLGGHPNRAGRSLLRHTAISTPPVDAQWADLAQHLADSWDSFTEGLPLYDPRMDPASPLNIYSPERSPDGGDEVAAVLEDWRRSDPVALRGRRPTESPKPAA